jgi:5-carboxymethyl-2-hydroxymuconate isomerase
MPHLTIEHSGNLDDTDIAGACAALHAVLAQDGAFELGAIRVRAVRCDISLVADLHADNAFFAMLLRIGAGRSDGDKDRIGQALMAAMQLHFAMRLQVPHFALSLDIVENTPAFSWKSNSIHPRLRAAKGAT